MVEDTQKRYADDVTVQELVRLRVENERLQEALRLERQLKDNALRAFNEARSALQQKDSE